MGSLKERLQSWWAAAPPPEDPPDVCGEWPYDRSREAVKRHRERCREQKACQPLDP